jgi:DNA-binding PadR family transcriptional regulator
VSRTTEIGTKLALLQALAHHDGTVFDLVRHVHEATNGRVTVDLGCAYPALRELEAEGLAAKYKGKRTLEGTGRGAQYYKLTAAGRTRAMAQAKALRGLLELGKLL